jgi:hypothetical protein
MSAPATARGAARINRILGAAALLGIASFAVVTFQREAEWFTDDFPEEAVTGVAAATRSPQVRVYASEVYADWLLWRQRDLRGRVAFDARFELLQRSELEAIAKFAVAAGNWRRTVRDYRIFVLENEEPRSDIAVELRSEPGARTVFEDDRLLVVSR